MHSNHFLLKLPFTAYSVFWAINQLTTHLTDALHPFPHWLAGDLVQKGGESMQQVTVCEHKEIGKGDNHSIKGEVRRYGIYLFYIFKRGGTID